MRSVSSACVGAASLVVALVATASCRPVGLVGDSCEHGPCVAGLVCVDEVCEQPEVAPPPPAPCEEDADCTIDGSADGRVCEDGVCDYAECTFDLECGSRICDDGRCADRVPCFDDDDCDDAICADGVCRTPCYLDEECAIGGLPLAACVDGECEQRCLGDITCLGGGICENNVCIDPECAVDEDCTGAGSYYCDAGRCTQYTPCDEDDDCFDPNFLCNELGRCEERPLCFVDADCGAGLCIDGHCREATPCTDASECEDGEECVAGRCTDAPGCRGNADCEPEQVCDGARCVPAAEPFEAAWLLADYGLGACDGEGGVCAAVLLVGETFDVRVQGYAATGLPVVAAFEASLSLSDAAAGSIAVDDAGVQLSALQAATGTLSLVSGDATVTLALSFVADAPQGCEVLVVDGGSGAPVAGAEVRCGDSSPAVTDSEGHAAVDVTLGDDGVRVRAVDGRGLALLVDPVGQWRIVLPAPEDARRAGMQVSVVSTGDELGPVGMSFALPALARASDATIEALFGPPFVGTVEVPLLGPVAVTLPAAAVVDGALPLSEPQVVKQAALLTTPAGAALGVAYEGRRETDALIQLALGVDPVNFALDLASQAEGDDVRMFGAGLGEPRALVIDGDVGDGIEDIDGDGDITELVPDYAAFPAVEVAPADAPLLRTGLIVGPPPAGARPRMLASCGVEPVGRFVPLGVSAVFGSDAEGAGTGEQLKVAQAGAALAYAPRVCAAHAAFVDDASTSFALARAEALTASIEVGALLSPPAGAFVLDGVPEPGRASIVLPAGAQGDLVVVTLFDGATVWQVAAPATGSLVLPPEVTAVFLAGTGVARLDGGALAPFAIGFRPARSVREVATAFASAP